MMNNGGSGSLKGSKPIGKTGLDFNLTQPIQLSGSMQGGHGTKSGGSGQFVSTQPGLQKILRQLNKQSAAAAAAHLTNTATGAADKNHQQQYPANTNSQQSSKNNMAHVVTQRKSSSNKSRRIDVALNQQIQASSSTGPTQQNNKTQPPSLQPSSSLNPSDNAGTSQSSKGRSHLKNQLGDNIQKLPNRTSRNPRQVDGMPLLPPPSQSNTNPVVHNSGLSFNLTNQPIGPTMGTESGGGHGPALSQNVARSASGKRLQRNSENMAHQPSSSHQSKLHATNASKFINGHGSQGNSIPQHESRFAQRLHKMPQVHHTEPSGSVQVLSQETSNPGNGSVNNSNGGQQSANNAASSSANAKYFSQRLQNQMRGPKGQQESEKQSNGSQGVRTSKDELLRAFIKPSSGVEQAKNEIEETARPQRQSSQPHNSTEDVVSAKNRQSSSTRTNVKNGLSGLNELGGFQGTSLDKIQAKANKLKQGLGPTPSGIPQDDKTTPQSAKNSSLSQAATQYRAKLLRSQESNNSLPNRLNNATKKTIKDEPAAIQNPLNILKKTAAASSSKQTDEAAALKKKNTLTTMARKAQEEAKRKEAEKNLGPDDIVEYRGMKMTVSQREEYMEMEEEQIQKFRQNYYPAKFASKKNGVVVTYAANTHQGMVRNYNEDRVSIILNIIKPKFKQIDFWPRCSFFAIYDGHGGAQCADFLRDQLHQMIVRDSEFPQNPIKAMQRGFEQAEKNFLEFAHNESNPEAGSVQRSGSCAIVVLIVGEVAYVANVGDSRAFMSIDGGSNIVPLSIDHKPESDSETARIEGNGGKVYQNQSYIPDPSPGNSSGTQTLIGPHRVFPGRLSVSRTIGDIEAKDERYGGNPNVVIATPEIRAFKIKDNYDFIAIGCDGVFEKMDNQEVMESVWEASLQPENLKSPQSMHARCGAAVDSALNECVNQKTLDNITTVVIGFNNFEKMIDKARTTGGRNDLIRDSTVVADEVELEWEQEMQAIEESDSNKVIQKLMKPLEPVEEEMIENSELETPLSEVIDVTRKKMTSKHRLLDPPDSHNSSVSDRYASSSRRQSQLLEAQDTQNLIDHDLLNSQEVRSLANSRKNLHQGSNNNTADEEQAGIAQKKSATQIGQSDLNHDSTANLPSGGEQGSTRTTLVQKDYKIRQASASPARVQRQNSDRTMRRQQESQPNVRQNGPSMGPMQPTNPGSISIPTMSGAATSIPTTKTSKTPLNPSNKGQGSRNLIDMKSSYERPTNKQNSQLNNARPITPKRVIASQPQKVLSAMHSKPGENSRESQKEILPLSAGNPPNGQGSNKNARTSARRRDDTRPEDISAGIPMGKFTKKMVSNWVGGNPSQQSSGSFQQTTNINSHNYMSNNQVNNLTANSFQTGPSTSKNMVNLTKSYLSTGSSKSQGAAVSSKNRTQRVNETIKSLITNGQSRAGENIGTRDSHVQDLIKDQLNGNGDLSNQFNTFNGQIKPPLFQDSSSKVIIQQQSQNSGSQVRQRKKSSGKASLGNKSMRQANNGLMMNNTQTVSMRHQNDPTNPSHEGSSLMKPQRSSASRNKPSHLIPVVGSNSQPQNNYVSQQQPGGGQGTNITLNFNQINLTTGSNRLPQHHHPQISQGAIGTNSFSSNGGGGGLGSNAAASGAIPTANGSKQWYSNTINLAGIKQISASAIKQASSQQPQQNSGSNSTKTQPNNSVVIKRLRDQ